MCSESQVGLHDERGEAGGEAGGRETLVEQLLVEAEVRIDRRWRGGEA